MTQPRLTIPALLERSANDFGDETYLVTPTDRLTYREAQQWLDAVERRARELHRRYVDKCNRPLTPDEESRIEQLEGFMRETFKGMGLGLYLNEDPRGNPVGILTPKTGRYNTMGGRECGWRL